MRDCSFTLDALIGLHLSEEVRTATSWRLAPLGRSAPELHVLSRLDGWVASEQRALGVAGYRSSARLVSGSSASRQGQLGADGEPFDTSSRSVRTGHHLEISTPALLARLADQCCEQWTSMDSGIWEPGEIGHHTISRIGCWDALDRAVDPAECGQLPVERATAGATKPLFRRFVEERCWSAKGRAYSFYAGTDELDAAVVLAGQTGVEHGARRALTIEAVIRELRDGPCIDRDRAMSAEEGALVACSFWVVDALIFTGQLDRTGVRMDQAVGLRSGPSGCSQARSRPALARCSAIPPRPLAPHTEQWRPRPVPGDGLA